MLHSGKMRIIKNELEKVKLCIDFGFWINEF